MEEAAGSGIGDAQGQAGARKKATPRRRRRMKDLTPAERTAAVAFIQAAIDDLKEYMAMTEEEVEEQYRGAGKLHLYDPDMELKKRCARVARKNPPPDGFYPEIEEYRKLIEDEEEGDELDEEIVAAVGEQGQDVREEKATTPLEEIVGEQEGPAGREGMKDWTPAEMRAAKAFMHVLDDLRMYVAMTEAEVEDVYRRMGKLHLYDPKLELKKRYARIAMLVPPPAGFDPDLDEYSKLIEDEVEEAINEEYNLY